MKFSFLSFILATLFSFSPWYLLAENNPNKSIKASRCAQNIKIDGLLTEDIWMSSEKASTFIQNEPIPGKAATFETESYFIYDNNAVYIGARMYDTSPDKILKELSLRDQVGNADNFTVFFDTYKSGLNGFLFTVTASGVQAKPSFPIMMKIQIGMRCGRVLSILMNLDGQ